MPLHDWTRVVAGHFHAFHFHWIASLSDALNANILPDEYYAIPEQKAVGFVPDILTLRLANGLEDHASGGLAVETEPPRSTIVTSIEENVYASKANRIAIHQSQGDVVAVIEIVSPGNKSSKAAFNSFIFKAVEFLQRGIHLLVIDLLPPGPRDPLGVHKAIWDEFRDEPFTFPVGKDRLFASYHAATAYVAYVEPLAVGDVLPQMPLFLTRDVYVQAPLEDSYQAAWNHFPRALRKLLQ